MKINESQGKLISDRVNDIWKGKRECPICISPVVWNIGGIIEAREFNEGNHCPGAAITPLVQVECNRCSYTLLFNAIGIGVVDRDTGKVEEAK